MTQESPQLRGSYWVFFGQRSNSDLPLSLPVNPSPEDTGRLKASRGQRFGRYETLFRIAGGGMAEVYAARIVGEGGFEKVVALKRMLPTLADDERFVSMFLDEGRVAAHISSPNVVQTLDLGRADDNSLYLVMELVVGVPLGQLIRGVLKSGEYVALDVAVEIMAQAATGLHDAHEATTPLGDPLKLIHRDVSPQNILVDRAGRTRITDFGVARAMQSHSQTQAGEVKGKMAYFAPEQARGGTLTSRVDIFALGIVAWELVTGRRLFKSDNPLNILRKVLDEPIPTVHEYRQGVPEQLGACIAKALERDPDDRYESARAFAQALRSAIKPAPPSAVGDYVKLHGAEALAPLENGLKRALSNEPDDEATRVASLSASSSSGISTSAVVPTGSLSSSQTSGLSETSSTLALNAVDSAPRPAAAVAQKRTGLILGVLAAGLAAIGVFFAVRPTTTSTALEPEETPPAAAAPRIVGDPQPGSESRESPSVVEVAGPESEVEAEPTPEAETMRARPRMTSGMRPSMAQTAAATPVEVPSMQEETPSAMEPEATTSMTTPMVTPMTTPIATPMTTTPADTPETEPTGEMTSEMSESSMGLLMQWGDP